MIKFLTTTTTKLLDPPTQEKQARLTRIKQKRQYKQRVCTDETIQNERECWAAQKQQ